METWLTGFSEVVYHRTERGESETSEGDITSVAFSLRSTAMAVRLSVTDTLGVPSEENWSPFFRRRGRTSLNTIFMCPTKRILLLKNSLTQTGCKRGEDRAPCGPTVSWYSLEDQMDKAKQYENLPVLTSERQVYFQQGRVGLLQFDSSFGGDIEGWLDAWEKGWKPSQCEKQVSSPQKRKG